MTLDFYTNPMSRGQIVRWALEEVGAAYNERIVAYGPEMKSDAYLAINPMGKVPAIVHDGAVVTEVAAICAYLASQFPHAGLLPDGHTETARYYRAMFFAAGPIEQAVTANSLGWVPTEEQIRTAGFGSYDLMVGGLETLLAGSAFVCGDRFTMADVSVGAQVIWGTQFKTLPERDAFSAYAARCAARPAFKTAKARDDALIAAATSGG